MSIRCRYFDSLARQRGFTLIELLVVICVITVLSAMLFTVIVRAKDSARQATCISNLRQIGVAFQMYMDDFERRPIQLDGLVKAGYISDPQILICLDDPTGNRAAKFWQDISDAPKLSVPTSYLYFSGYWPDDYWQRLMALGPTAPIVVCQCHGDRTGNFESSSVLGEYENKVLRLNLDGSVRVGNITWARGKNPEMGSWILFNPWKLLTGKPGEPPFDDQPH